MYGRNIMDMNVRVSSCFSGYDNCGYYRPSASGNNSAGAVSEPLISMNKPKSRADEAMDQIGKKAADIAVSQDGIEELTGNNDGKDIDRYRYNNKKYRGLPWCAAFYNWCYNPGHKSGGNVFGLSDRDVLSTQKVLRAAKKENCFIPANSGIAPRVGDGIIWRSEDDPTSGHIAIVIEVHEDGSFVTEHGNNNDAVQRIEYPSIDAAMIRINSEGKSQALQGFVEAPKYFSRKKFNVKI